MTRPDCLKEDGRTVIIAIDHSLYSWPCPGLEDRKSIIAAARAAGVDAMIASYGTIRDFRSAFGHIKPILKLDVTSLTLGGHYPLTEYVMAYDLDDAARLGVATVLNYIQLGAPFELEALRLSARLAAECDARGFTYLCEIMPVESEMYPTPEAPEAIAAACRTGQELGAHMIKTTMPVPREGIAGAVAACNIPVVLAGGTPAKDSEAYDAAITKALASGIAGVAIGRNAWGASDPAQAMRRFCRLVHGSAEAGEDAA
jgi:DhnA family fructose-bisphosphate aldolase class Ia